MEKPLISVIVPIYNARAYLPRCLDSIVGQTYSNLEIILVDDGSIDDSYAICQTYAEKDGRIVLIKKENGGQADARNKALGIARGEYIGFVDSDDEISLDMYESLYKNLMENHADIAMCGRYNVDELTEEKKPLFVFDEKQLWTTEEAIRRFLVLDGIDGSACDKLFSRRVIADVRFPLGLICEDIPFIYNILKNTDRVVHIGVPMYFYLQRSGSTSRSRFTPKTMGRIKYTRQIRDDVYQNYKDIGVYADWLYYSQLIMVADMLVTDREWATYKQIRKSICQEAGYICKNTLLSKRLRVMAQLICTGLYLPMKLIRTGLRKSISK